MNQKQFEKIIHDKVRAHQTPIDTDLLWQDIEQDLPKEKKRRGLFLWLLFGVLSFGLGTYFFFQTGKTTEISDTTPIATIVEETSREVPPIQSNQLAASKLTKPQTESETPQQNTISSSKQNLIVQKDNDITQATSSNKPLSKSNHFKFKNNIEQSNFITTKNEITPSKTIVAIDKSTSDIEEKPMLQAKQLTPNWTMLHLSNLELEVEEKYNIATIPSSRWGLFVELNTTLAKPYRNISTTLNNQLFTVLREDTEQLDLAQSLQLFLGLQHHPSQFYVKTGINYSQINERFYIKELSQDRIWDENATSSIIYNINGESTTLNEGNWMIQSTTRTVRHYNQFRLLDVSVLLGRSFNITKRWSWNAELGMAHNIFFQKEGRRYNSELEIAYFEDLPYRQKIAWSLLSGLGLHYQLSDNIHVKAGVQYQNYLNSFLEMDASTSDKYQLFGGQLGIQKHF